MLTVFARGLSKPDSEAEIICIDSKVERGTHLGNGRNPDVVSAYSFNTGIIPATEACHEKSDEIKAVPLLLDKIKAFRAKLHGVNDTKFFIFRLCNLYA